MQNSTVFACTRIIAETIGSLPLVTYQTTPRGRMKATRHPMYSILHDSPNPEMTALEFKEAVVGHMVRWGNAYANIQPLDDGSVNLWPLRPDRMTMKRQPNGRPGYLYSLPSGEQRALRAEEVWHLKAFGDGSTGYSVIQAARHAIELSLAAEEYGSRLFGNMSAPGGVLTTEKSLSEKALRRMKGEWEDFHQGLTMAHRVAVLEEGIRWQTVTVPPEDAQFLQTRKFQKTDITAFFRIPPHMVGDLERATFSNIEQQSLEFVTYTLLPWLTRIEQSAQAKFLDDPYYTKFTVQALLRGTMKERYEAFNIGLQGGWLSPDAILELEDMNAIGSEKGGDVYRFPVNTIPSDKAREYGKHLVARGTIPEGVAK